MSHEQHAYYAPYVPDTTVEDPPLDRGDEAEMQVTLDGGTTWHRELLGGVDITACDEVYRFSETERRPPKLVGKLCPKCFTPREITAALEALAKERREADGFIGINPRRRR